MLAMLSNFRCGEKTKKCLWRSESKDTGSPKDWDLVTWLQKVSPPPTSSPHHETLIYCSTLSSVHHAHLSTKKWQDILRGRKHSLKRVNNHQNLRIKYGRNTGISDQALKNRQQQNTNAGEQRHCNRNEECLLMDSWVDWKQLKKEPLGRGIGQ